MSHSVIFPYINFILFLLILYYVARKPSRAFAQKQKEDFEKLRREAQKAQDVAEEKLHVLEARKSELRAEIQSLKKAYKEDTEEELQQLEEKNQKLVSYVLQESKRVCERVVNKAKDQLRQEIWDQSLVHLQDRVRNKLSKEEQSSIVDAQLQKLEKMAEDVLKGSTHRGGE